MTKISKAKVGERGPWFRLFEVMATDTSHLYQFSHRDVDDAQEIRFKHKGGNEWLVICKRVGEDGGPEVLFATGYDFIAAMLALNAGLAAGKWREDKPWKPA